MAVIAFISITFMQTVNFIEGYPIWLFINE